MRIIPISSNNRLKREIIYSFGDPTPAAQEFQSISINLRYEKGCITNGRTAASSRLYAYAHQNNTVMKNSATGLAHFNEIRVWGFFRGLSIQKNCHSPTCRLGGFLSFQHEIHSELLKPQRTYLGSLFRDRNSRISISKGPLLISLQVCRPNFQDWIELEEAGQSDTGGYVALF